MMDPEVAIIILICAVAWLPFSLAYTPQYCFEDTGDLCGIASGNVTLLFSGLLMPLEEQVPGFGAIIFLGGIFAILWFKTENIMLLAIVGVFFVGSLGVVGSIITLSDQAIGIGLLLLAAAMGVLIFQLLRQRIALFG